MNKLIVVTGGTKGIGLAIIEKFASEGFDIITCARNERDLQQLKDRMAEIFPASTVMTMVVDMAEKESLKKFTDFCCSHNRSIDVLVNNAGYFIPGAIATEQEGALESMMNANLYSAYHTTRRLLPVMQKYQAGHIFNMCSIASIKAYANGGSYAITKFALLGFSKCLREELKTENIRVTAVLPGATLTASWAGTELPEERFMRAEDVAEAVYACYHLSERTVVEEILLRPLLGDI